MEKLISFLNNSISPYHAVNSLEQELIKCRNAFIREFRSNNKEEITKYLQLKDQF